MKKSLSLIILFLVLISAAHAQMFHSVASYSYLGESLYAKVIKANPSNPKIIYVGAQHVNLSYKGFFDTYDLSNPDTVKRTKRMGILPDSFGVTDFVFRGADIYAIGSKGLQIINTATPTSPTLTKNIRTFKDGTTNKAIGYFTASILIDGNKLHYGGSNYYLIDISNLNSLIKLGERSYSGINSGSIQLLATDKVIVGSGYDLNIFDVSAPPTVTKTILSSFYGDPKQMLYDLPKKILYTTFETSSKNFVYSMDMTSNTKLDSFNYLSVPGFNPSSHSGLCLHKDTLYVGTSQGVALFDVSNPADLRFLGKLSTGGSSAVFVNDEYLITNDNYNLRFYRRGPASVSRINEKINFSTIELFPNPAQKSVNLILNQSAQARVLLFDKLGKPIKEWNASESAFNHEIPIANMEPGIYFVQINTGNQSATRKLVIE